MYTRSKIQIERISFAALDADGSNAFSPLDLRSLD